MRITRLSTVKLSICSEVDKILRQDFNKQLYTPKDQDQVRLLKLRVWSERYKISIKYILSNLLSHYEQVSKKFRTRITKGLGVGIPLLTGPAAEEYLKTCIARDFPDSENIAAWREEEKQHCFELLDKAELVGRAKRILAYQSVSEFVKAYKSKVENARNTTSRRETKLAKQPYRGNAFR